MLILHGTISGQTQQSVGNDNGLDRALKYIPELLLQVRAADSLYVFIVLLFQGMCSQLLDIYSKMYQYTLH